MLARSGARVKVSDSVASVRYDDGSVREFALDRLRLADFRDSVPWRQVRSLHGQAHSSGSYASATMGGFVVYESRLELARLLLADFDPQVRGIYAQPFLLVARVSGRARRHRRRSSSSMSWNRSSGTGPGCITAAGIAAWRYRSSPGCS
jgi:hypothetical protein